MNEILLVVLAYCIGSIPTSIWVSKRFFGIDIRDYGSGNAGATNTFRTLGSKWGTIVMVVDILKGVIATSLYILLPSTYMGSGYEFELHRTNFMIALGLSAVLGHIFPIWANFKGGKGVATLFGMAIAIQPLVAVCCIGVFLFVLYLTRFVSLSSILAGIAFMVFIVFIFNEKETLYKIFAILVALMVVLTHQKNIGRILKGTESKVPILKFRDNRKKRKSK
jgi:glycerol-3-phosphate acyltransferase PlsY